MVNHKELQIDNIVSISGECYIVKRIDKDRIHFGKKDYKPFAGEYWIEESRRIKNMCDVDPVPLNFKTLCFYGLTSSNERQVGTFLSVPVTVLNKAITPPIRTDDRLIEYEFDYILDNGNTKEKKSFVATYLQELQNKHKEVFKKELVPVS